MNETTDRTDGAEEKKKKITQKQCGKIVQKKEDTTLANTDGHTLNEKELLIYVVINGQFE